MDNTYFKNEGKWWDKYSQEDLVIWDEFRGHDVSSFLQILNYLPYQVECKGGSVHINSKAIIFTSNLSIEEAFKECDFKTMQAIKRRLTIITF